MVLPFLLFLAQDKKPVFPNAKFAQITYTIDYEPFWSPDGKMIALVSSRPGQLKLHVLDIEKIDRERVDMGGSGMKLLTKGRDEDDSPAWSPDGKHIAYVTIKDGVSQIAVINPDGTGQRLLTTGKFDNIHPAWTPDSRRVMFNTSRYEAENKAKKGPLGAPTRIGEQKDWYIDLASVNLDGSDWKRITIGGGYTYAFISPDGTKIVHRRTLGADSQIWLMNSDGTDDHNISGDSKQDGWPSWAPDSKRVCFVRRIDDKLQICVMNSDGSGFQQLSASTFDCTNPRWSPDGKAILFTRRMGNISLFLMRAP